MASFKTLVNQLKKLAPVFDEKNNSIKYKALQNLCKCPLPPAKDWSAYQHFLIYLAAHAQDAAFLELVNKEKERLSKQIKKASAATKQSLQNTGLPYTTTLSSFSHDLLCWISENPDILMRYHYSSEEEIQLRHILQFTLPHLEKNKCQEELDQDQLLEALQVKPNEFLPFLLDQFSKLNSDAPIKDFLWNKYNLFVELSSEKPSFSTLYNQLSFAAVYYHHNFIHNFDYEGLLHNSLPEPTKLSHEQIDELVSCMRTSLLLLEQETDASTYFDRRTLRYYQLERGISIAIYGATPNRQLPMQSQVGYMLFKNGYPAAYGDIDVYGKRGDLRIHLLEQMRDGESGFLFVQLLRTYKQALGVTYFEIEPYLFELNNPELIDAEAFWFYYRFGFRLLNKQLDKLAEEEADKIKNKKAYRPPVKTMARFSESNMALNLGGLVPPRTQSHSDKVTTFMERNYKSNRSAALQDSLSWFRNHANFNRMCSKHEEAVLQDVSLIAMANNIQDENKLDLLQEMISTKPVDIYSFQEALLQFLE